MTPPDTTDLPTGAPAATRFTRRAWLGLAAAAGWAALELRAAPAPAAARRLSLEAAHEALAGTAALDFFAANLVAGNFINKISIINTIKAYNHLII